ncbi:unnamed protein product [Camellia sinensis]
MAHLLNTPFIQSSPSLRRHSSSNSIKDPRDLHASPKLDNDGGQDRVLGQDRRRQALQGRVRHGRRDLLRRLPPRHHRRRRRRRLRHSPPRRDPVRNRPSQIQGTTSSPSPPPSPVSDSPPAVEIAAASKTPAAEGGKRIVASPFANDVEASAAAGGGASGGVEAAMPSPGIELGSVVPFTIMQSAVSRNMVESLAVPTFRVGIKLKGVTMAALLAKATALAFIKHPVVNSSCRYGKNFTYNGSINIAVTVAIDDGLSTPVLQDADKSTFTLSNLGMFGVDRFDAICHQELVQSWLLEHLSPLLYCRCQGWSDWHEKPDEADHRVIYGADLASFLQTLAKIIEDPKDLTL